MNMFTRKMRMLTAVVLDEDKDKVVKMLLEKGICLLIPVASLMESFTGEVRIPYHCPVMYVDME